MNSYALAEKKRSGSVEMMGRKRQEKALREFKEVLRDLALMLRESTGTETVYLYWINRAREQFVMETKSTTNQDIVFQDRVSFSDHFLDAYKDIRQPVTLRVGSDIDRKSIQHYYDGELPVEEITLLPFTNNDETVAITVLESKDASFSIKQNEIIYSYSNALGNVLNTYLEISDLYENQQEWVAYEDSLSFLNKSGHSAGLLNEMLQTMQNLVGEGSVSLLVNGMGRWINILNSAKAQRPLPIGMPVEERTIAWEALKKGAPEFAIHFNKNPKRISPREIYTQGATLAIPIIFNDHRKGLVLVYEQNPLVFKESTKHKLINIVRLTGLEIKGRLNKKDDDNLLTNDYGALIPDLWERAIDGEIDRLKEGNNGYKTWVSLVSLTALSELRTKLRLEELALMQKDLVNVLNPSRCGIPGFVGFNTDYIYLVVLQSKDSNAIEHWKSELRETFQQPFELSNNKQIETDLNFGTVRLTGESRDSYHVVSDAKRALSQDMNSNKQG